MASALRCLIRVENMPKNIFRIFSKNCGTNKKNVYSSITIGIPNGFPRWVVNSVHVSICIFQAVFKRCEWASVWAWKMLCNYSSSPRVCLSMSWCVWKSLFSNACVAISRSRHNFPQIFHEWNFQWFFFPFSDSINTQYLACWSSPC